MSWPPFWRPVTKNKISNGRQIATFIALTFLLSAIVQIYIIREIKTTNTFAVVLLTWIPGLVAIFCSKTFRHKFRDLALIKPGYLSIMFAYLIPMFAIVLMFLVLIVTGIGKFKMPDNNWFRYVIFQPTIGVLVNGVVCLGQELGWRGFLHNRLMRAQIPEPLIVTGAVWAIWNWPLILFLDYATSPLPWLSVTLFSIQTICFAIVLGWLREFSKSIFPPVLAHSVHLTWLQYIVPAFYSSGKLDPYFGGQSGFILAIIYVFVAVYLYVRHPVATY